MLQLYIFVSFGAFLELWLFFFNQCSCKSVMLSICHLTYYFCGGFYFSYFSHIMLLRQGFFLSGFFVVVSFWGSFFACSGVLFFFLGMDKTDMQAFLEQLIFMIPCDCENLIALVFLDVTMNWPLQLIVQLSRNRYLDNDLDSSKRLSTILISPVTIRIFIVNDY